MKTFKSKIALAMMAAGLSFAASAADITVAYAADPVSLDPHEQLSGGTLQLSHMVFDPLVRFNQSMEFEPRLAESWERVDNETMRFNLRKGVKFHSGNTLTADDVVWTFNRLKSSPDFKGIFEPLVSLTKVDDYTVEIKTDGTYPLIENVATYIFPMDSKFYSGKTAEGKDKAELVKHGNSFASANLSGTGPFIVKEREQGVKVEFERFADYWDNASGGNVDKLTLVPIKEDATRVAALLSGGVDMIAPVSPNDYKRIEKAKGIDLYTMPGTRIITFQMNQNSNPALKDERVRQAIVYAVNNEGIAKKVMKGAATASAQQSPPGYAGYNENLKPRYDLNKAKQLMKDAGYPDGFKLTMMAPNNRYVNDDKIAQATAAMLSKIGIKVDLKTMPKAQYWPEFDKCAADMMMIGWHPDTEDSANFTEFLAMTRNADTGKGQYNCGHYSNSEVDKLVNAANKETDLNKRNAMLKQVEETLYNEAAFLPLHWQDPSWAAKSNVEIGPIVNGMNFPYFGDLVVK
ncbi:nickel/dipeptide/oligopeptide ABC transporter substrate-binding protein [Enterovibrio norvegicus]|uniref:ABC transporter substrate-binding protein n=1 Tax=Enterovibrio norvegicus TaxID=188144 RepID=UPI000C83251B|nr:ABC transporter substrate-binding protein [Enterovibrio norvegicus]MCC4800801.1 ABC transporter substrate-binding protein [Enterovibrio norvegicus]PMH60514.1 nickel/dipeptide/oligopeptide ABC transporter substrate-binding protein [Enterovibrio norvegicus]PMI32618.1 nickel/dipeptide/oligopeptide ABC transporter substrate-binding protein [Enterovibrio norvegicus]PMI41764.1 nickel/dipeptide/oligopeptide ABC transporter substrate-binding protein [Enterovibrio norvegicus]PMN55351.1 nickel/dipept